MRLAPASRSNHSLSTMGRRSTTSIPETAIGHYNGATRPNDLVDTRNNYLGYVPSHANHPSVNTTHTTNTFGVRMHGNVSSSSVGSYWNSESQRPAYLQRNSYVQPDGQASTSTRSSPYGHVPYGGQSKAGSSSHSSYAHGY